MSTAVFVILVGPGVRERRRFVDLLLSLRHFEAELLAQSSLILVDDGDESITGALDPKTYGFRQVRVLINPYRKTGGGQIVYDRLMAGIIVALRQIVEMEDVDFVLKLDTDALIIGHFQERIKAFLEQHPEAGMIGSFHHDPDGSVRGSEAWWGNHILKTCGMFPTELIRLHFRHRMLFHPVTVALRWRRRRRWVRDALRNGWHYGDHILGGAYVLSRQAIQRLRNRTALIHDPKLFEGTRIPEDIGLSILVPALGLQLREHNRPGEVFGIWYQQPTRSIAELISDGYGIVHSIKSVDEKEEEQLRASAALAAGMKLSVAGLVDL
jgi:hypothetical protein